MRMMKSMAEKKLRKMGMKRMKKRVIHEEKREYYEEKVKEMNEEGRVGTMESLKRAQTKGVKLLRETASLLIPKYEDLQY
jgi:hypothetical protein